MALCANCGSEQPDNLVICRNCGAPMERPVRLPPDNVPGVLPDRRGTRALRLLLISLLVGALVGVIAFIALWYATYRLSRGMPMSFFQPPVYSGKVSGPG